MTFDYSAYLEVKEYVKNNSIKPVKIIAVSKNHSEKSIKTAISYGVNIFGENQKFSKFS